MSIGLRIKKLRAAQGWSQKELGEKSGIHKALIARYELNLANPTVNGLIKLTKVFNVSADYVLFGRSGETTLSDRELFELFKEADCFDPKNRQIIKYLLQAAVSYEKIKK